MLKKSLFLMATLGMVAAVGFGESTADDVEKAQRFRAAEYKVASNESGACATATAEKAALVAVENPFDMRQRADGLHLLGSNAQLEVLGAASSSSWSFSSSYRRTRYCWITYPIFFCF